MLLALFPGSAETAQLTSFHLRHQPLKWNEVTRINRSLKIGFDNMYYVTLTYLHVIVEYMTLASLQMTDHAGILQERSPFNKKIMINWLIFGFFRFLPWPWKMG